MTSLKECRLYKAANCGTPIECEHGYDVCPMCDPCTCGPGQGHKRKRLVRWVHAKRAATLRRRGEIVVFATLTAVACRKGPHSLYVWSPGRDVREFA